ncbi:MAG: ATP-dependent Clp protease proteolytic subunit [Sphingobium sp.]
MANPRLYPLLARPNIGLAGPVDYNMYGFFRQALISAPKTGPLVISLTTMGGDPEVARAMGDDVRIMQEHEGRELLFLGQAAVYSAGATFMSYFARDKRFLTRGTRVMIHERQITKTINLSGPLRMCVATLKATLNEIEHSINIEEEGFRELIEGSNIGFDEVHHKAPENWYIDAEDARDMGLVLDVI